MDKKAAREYDEKLAVEIARYILDRHGAGCGPWVDMVVTICSTRTDGQDIAKQFFCSRHLGIEITENAS